MYERNINVLEMFLEKKLGYVETNNIKNNYSDYQELVKVLDDYINICNEEKRAKKEYADAVTNIQEIQATKEKLYNQNVKFEYSRNLLLSDINRKVEDIEKCLVKIEGALDKNTNTFKFLRKNFIQGIINLNDKHRNFKKIARPKNKIEAEYKEALSLLKENYRSINPDDIELTKKFIESSSDFETELIEKMLKNGKDEKVPFDKNAITAAVKLGLDIAQKEAENYLFMYEQTGKILNELANDKLKIEARKKHITDTQVKLSFLKTEKEYLFQFLDNERVTAIQGAAEHDRLMKNCCSILKEDVAQINILYDLIIKETKKRATNRCYEELYNKSYVSNIEEKEKKFIEKTSNLNYANGTIISPNYWRIDSIKAIYNNFDKNVYEIYGRKFVAPDDNSLSSQETPQIVERVVERVVEKVVEKPVEKIIERVIEKPIENGVYQESNDIIPKKLVAQKELIPENEQAQDSIQSNTLKKTFPKFRRIQKPNQILEEDFSINMERTSNSKKTSSKIKNETQDPKSNPYIIQKETVIQPQSAQLQKNEVIREDDDDLDDLESIIKEAQESISEKTRKTNNLIKKIVKKNKEKYVED